MRNGIRRLMSALCFIWWAPAVVSAQSGDLYFHHLTPELGLSQSNNLFVFKDSRGFVWISSTNGLNRFDGSEVKVYQPNPADSTAMLGSNIQSQFFEDQSGNIWFSTYEAINCYDRRRDRFRHYQIKSESGQALPGYCAVGLDSNQCLWVIARSDKLYLLDTETGTFSPQTKLLKQAHRGERNTDSKGKTTQFLSFSFDAPGLCMTEYQPDGRIKGQDTLFTVAGNGGRLKIQYLYRENERLFWVATRQGLLKFDPVGRICHMIPSPAEAEADGFNAVVAFAEGSLLCSSARSGIFVFDKKTETFTQRIQHRAADTHSLTNNDLNKLARDADGNIWVSVPRVGVDYANLYKPKFKRLLSTATTDSLTSPLRVWAMTEDEDGNTWCSTYQNGIWVIDPAHQVVAHYFSGAKKPFSLPANRIFHLFRDSKGRIWAMTMNGLLLREPHSQSFKLVSNPKDGFFYGLELRNKQLLFSCAKGGIAVLQEDEHGTRLLKNVPGIDTSASYTLLFEDQQEQLYASKNLTAIAVYERRNHFNLLKEIPVGGVLGGIWEDKIRNQLWIATTYGLVKLDTKTFQYQVLGEENGLPGPSAYGLLPDQTGHLWVSTNRGLARMSLESGQFHHFRMADGLTSLEFEQYSFLKKRNGEFWFGSANGITCLFPEKTKAIAATAQPQITEIWVNDLPATQLQCTQTGAGNPSEIQSLEFDYQHHTLTFRLVALEYSDPRNARLRYIMEGVDADTVETQQGSSVRYPAIRPGRHLLKIWAANSDGVWNPQPRTLVILVHPPYWQTWWFRILITALILGAVGFGTAFYYRYRLRVQQLELERQQREADRKQMLLENELALQRERNRIADEMHDELGGGLSTIRLASERAKKMDAPDDLKNILARVSQISIGLIGNMRGIIWAMDTQNDSLDSLLGYMRQYVRTFLDDNAIEAQIQMPTDCPTVSLSGQYRHHVMLTVKECLNNILKHAAASRVTVHVEIGENLVIRIGDNGKGFDLAERLGSGKGLRTTAKRMESIHGSIEWRRNADRGMTAVLSAPIPKNT